MKAAPESPASRTVDIKDVLDHQRADDEAPQRFKVWRWGRRTGKSVAELKASIAGHGPLDAHGTPTFPGIVHGWAVAWLAPDYKQATNLWEFEIKPRFLNKDGIKIKNDSPYSVEFMTPAGLIYGGLYLYSNENVDAMRGLGNRMIGLVVEEAAHLDLGYAWGHVARPLLMDNAAKGSWAIFGSTTNAGLDGNAEKKAPSYFNRLCTGIMAGEYDLTQWRHSHLTARDNPKISRSEFESALADMAKEGPVAVAQEMEAELLTAGAGIAFPEWHAAYHVLPRSVVLSPEWPFFAGLDWGYGSPGSFVLLQSGPEKQAIARVDFQFQHQTAHEVGTQIGLLCRRYGIPEYIAYDSSMDETYKFAGFAASFEMMRALAETLSRAAPPLLPTVKEPGEGGTKYRHVRKIMLHEMLAFTEPKAGEIMQPWQRPRLCFHPDAALCISSIPVLPLDPKDPEDVDTKYPMDHPYDALTYALLGPIPTVRTAERAPERDRLYLNERGLPAGAGMYAPPPLVAKPEGFRFRRGEKREESV